MKAERNVDTPQALSPPVYVPERPPFNPKRRRALSVCFPLEKERLVHAKDE